MVIGLNPSTADETIEDATVRRCIGYARLWGFGALEMTNLYAYRATAPKELWRYLRLPGQPMDQGLCNNVVLQKLAELVCRKDGAILAAWGAGGAKYAMSSMLRALLDSIQVPVACLGLTRDGEPRHPLYLRLDTTPIPYLGDGGRLCRG